MAAEHRVITGTVAAANDRGLRLTGDSLWRNFSKWAETLPPEPPATGQDVALTLDAKGFIRRLEVVPPAHTNGSTPRPAEPVPSAQLATPDEPAQPGPAPDRERCIVRMACLNTTVAILSSGGRVVSDADVVGIASVLESWVCRPVDNTEVWQ